MLAGDKYAVEPVKSVLEKIGSTSINEVLGCKADRTTCNKKQER